MEIQPNVLSLSDFERQTGRLDMKTNDTADAVLCIAGDWAPIRAFAPLIETDPEAVYGDLLPVIRSADLAVVNLEAPLSDAGEPVGKSGAVFKGETRHVSGLSAAPFHVATLANNHMFDFGTEAFVQTTDTLDKNGIRHVGAGMNEDQAGQPLIIGAGGVSVGIVNFSEGEDLTAAGQGPGVMGWDLDRVTGTVADLKKKVDIVLVISHCGIEYVPFPPPYVVSAFEAAADAGADLVIGHHPHVPQGISFRGNVPICYSLGNFVFYQPTRLVWRKLGYMVNAGVSTQGLVSLEVVPYRIHDLGVSLLDNDESSRFFKKINDISRPLEKKAGLMDTWHGFLDYYGITGFEKEIAMIMEKLQADPVKGAAMFRNRLTTLQHFHHFKDLMTRIIKGQMNTSSGWARDLNREWLTLVCDDKNSKTI